MKLANKQIGLITDTVNDLFFKLKAAFLGRFFKGPYIYFEVIDDLDPMNTLEGLVKYTMHALYGPNAQISDDLLSQLSQRVDQYFDIEKDNVTKQILQEAKSADSFEDFKHVLVEQLDSVTSRVNLLVTSESRIAQAYAEKEGIMQLAASIGVTDPTVAKFGVIDDKTCENCIKLWHQPDNLFIPKVYKLSELKDGYNEGPVPIPTVGPTHPHCRHVLTFISPNFGFDERGRVKFMYLGYDVYADQRG